MFTAGGGWLPLAGAGAERSGWLYRETTAGLYRCGCGGGFGAVAKSQKNGLAFSKQQPHPLKKNRLSV